MVADLGSFLQLYLVYPEPRTPLGTPLRATLRLAYFYSAVVGPSSNMPQYTSRDVGDPSQIKKNKQSMADLKLRRLTELNNRLREDLERERIPISTASKR